MKRKSSNDNQSSLLKHFTIKRYNNNKNINEDDAIDCPNCSMKLSFDMIENHSDVCKANSGYTPNKSNEINNNNNVDINNNIFIKLMNSSKLNSNKLIFSLYLINNKLYPNISFSGNNIDKNIFSNNNDNITWKNEVNIKNFNINIYNNITSSMRIILQTNIPLDNQSANSNNSITNISKSIIKSMLQKAIRRKYSNKAYYLTIELMKQSLDDFLRRIIVICLEDSILHPGLPILVWLMMANSKGFKINNNLLHICCIIVMEICSVNYKDILDVTSYNNNNNSNDNIDNNSLDITAIPDSPARTIIVSLLLRASYGGMPGDMSMLRSYCKLWTDRLINTTNLSNDFIKSTSETTSSNQSTNSLTMYLPDEYIDSLININKWSKFCINSFTNHSMIDSKISVDVDDDEDNGLKLAISNYSNNTIINELTMKPNHLLPEGIDFHCDWQIVSTIYQINKNELLDYYNQYISKNYQSIDKYNVNIDNEIESRIKQCIWIFRSSINYRKLSLEFFNETDMIRYHNYLSDVLNQKNELVNIWKIIGNSVYLYCNNKCNQFSKSLYK